MAIEEDGIWFVAVTWAMTLLVAIFVVIRIYARVFLLSWLGLDDYAYILAFVFLVLFSIIMTVSSNYGFGQHNIPNGDDKANAHFYEGIGINLVSSGMIVAKCSLGFFLLRIVQEPWQKAAIWGVNLLLIGASVACCIVYWTQCRPVTLIWDLRVKGECPIPFVPAALAVTSVCVFADFFFAAFPWFVLWKVQMNKKDKALILTSLSVGLIAGVFGIKRTTEIGKLADRDYFLTATVPAAIWSVAEIVVTMICIGIPVCLPFFRMVHGKWTTKDPNSVNDNMSVAHLQHNGVPNSPEEYRGQSRLNNSAVLESAVRKPIPAWDYIDHSDEEHDVQQLTPRQVEFQDQKEDMTESKVVPKSTSSSTTNCEEQQDG